MKQAFTKFLTLLFKRPRQISETQAALYLYEFIEGFGGNWDWDDFTLMPIANPQLESVRKRAQQVNLPVDEEGLAILRRLLTEVERLNEKGKLSHEDSIANFQYLHLSPHNSPITPISKRPFSAVVVITTEVTSDWRHKVSKWLVDEGCLCMMAWGKDCSLWDDSVDVANLEANNWEDIPVDKAVTTTWHEDEPLSDVFWCANQSLFGPPKVSLDHLLILDVSDKAREKKMRDLFEKSCNKV
jgi:hypothetical protein